MPPAPPPHAGLGWTQGAPLPAEAPTFLQPSLSPPACPAEILQANDNLTQVINLYKQLVRGEEVNGDAAAGSIPGEQVAGGRGPRGWSSTESGVRALVPELGAVTAGVTLPP